MQTKFGPCVVANLDHCKVNLPKRFLKIFEDDAKFEQLNKKKLNLKYLGKKKNQDIVEFVPRYDAAPFQSNY